MFLPNYLSGNIKTNSIQALSACLVIFEAIWHFFTSDLTFFVHLDLATLATIRRTRRLPRALGQRGRQKFNCVVQKVTKIHQKIGNEHDESE